MRTIISKQTSPRPNSNRGSAHRCRMNGQGGLIAGAPEVPASIRFGRTTTFSICAAWRCHTRTSLSMPFAATHAVFPPRDEKHEIPMAPQLCATTAISRASRRRGRGQPLSELPADIKSCALLYRPLAPRERAHVPGHAAALSHDDTTPTADGQPSAEAHLRAKSER